MEKCKVIVSDKSFSYLLTRKQVKNINLRIGTNGDIVVSANPFVPKNKIDEFVSTKIKWILEKQSKVSRHASISATNYNKKRVWLFGFELKIKVIAAKYNKVVYDKEKINVYLKDEELLDKVLNNFLKKLSNDVFNDIFEITYKHLNNDYELLKPTLKIRSMTSRWGSCMPKKNIITLNSKLIHYPIEFIEYVCLHEYVHLIQPNHSKAFYNIIENYMPNYKEVIEQALS